jgi:hypothetical protein
VFFPCFEKSIKLLAKAILYVAVLRPNRMIPFQISSLLNFSVIDMEWLNDNGCGEHTI